MPRVTGIPNRNSLLHHPTPLAVIYREGPVKFNLAAQRLMGNPAALLVEADLAANAIKLSPNRSGLPVRWYSAFGPAEWKGFHARAMARYLNPGELTNFVVPLVQWSRQSFFLYREEAKAIDEYRRSVSA